MNELQMAAKSRECAQLVREGSFVKFTRDDGRGGHCALGFMDMVTGHCFHDYVEDSFPEFVDAVARPLSIPALVGYQLFPMDRDTWEVAMQHPVNRIAAWNNQPERTAQDLVDHFEAVALGLEIRALAEQARELVTA
jgi:hypothetical protein